MPAATPSPVLAYGLLGLPLAFAALPIYVHVPRLYAESTSLTLTAIGTLLLLTRVLDAGIDPWLGWLADRLPRRQMLLWALPPFALGFLALCQPSSDYPALWLSGSLLLTYLGFSAATVAYQAWGADIGEDTGTLTRLTAAREGFGLGGILLAATLPALLSTSLISGIRQLGWVLPPLMLSVIVVFLSRVNERRSKGAPRACGAESLRSGLGVVLRDPDFRRLLTIFVANGIAAALPATLFLFFVADVLQAEPLSGQLLALYFLSGAASLPLWVRLASAIGRPAAWLLAMILAMLAFAGAFSIGPGDSAPFAVICAASGLALGADLALPAAMAADLGNRLQRAGTCFGLWNFVAKLNLALAAGLALPLLEFFDYTPGDPTSTAALSFSYALLPLAFKSFAAVLLWRWRLTLEPPQ